jgi:hypothetical protein
MDRTPTDLSNARLTVTLRDATAADLQPDVLRLCESSYRRGVHQALALAGEIADWGDSVKEIRRVLSQAENVAGELRGHRRDQGHGMLIDYIRGRLRWPRRKAGAR